MNPNVPQKLAADIKSFSSSLEVGLSENLVSIVLYGGIVKNDFIKETIHCQNLSDISVALNIIIHS